MNEIKPLEQQGSVGGVQIALQTVYLKDSSYESPNGPRLPGNQTWEPKFQLNMNTSSEALSPEVHEVLLTITLEAKQGESTLYLVEIKQAGVFAVSGAAPEDLKRVIGSFCPSVLFPYAREVISDLITKGGFPNFLLPLVNFEALYAQAASAPAPTAPPPQANTVN
jgi:preprotein translocase subunit SecB